VAFETADAIRVLSTLGPDVAAAVTGPEGRDALGYARLVAHDLEETIGRDLAGALGLAQGFNALDGD
jgi:predicted lipoprotein